MLCWVWVCFGGLIKGLVEGVRHELSNAFLGCSGEVSNVERGIRFGLTFPPLFRHSMSRSGHDSFLSTVISGFLSIMDGISLIILIWS